MVVVQHIHIADVRPDGVYRTGVIQPYPIQEGPDVVAAKTIESFNIVRPGGPYVAQGTGFGQSASGYEMAPEEIAMAANRLAAAMAQGYMPQGLIDEKLVYAAKLIMSGQPFVVRSAGRAAVVRAADAPSSVAALIQGNPASWGVQY